MKDKIIKAWMEFFSQQGSLYRYSLSYCLLLAVFPSLVILVILFQNGVLDITVITDFIYQYIPSDVLEPFMQYILEYNYQDITTVLVTIGFTSFLASRSFYTFLLISANHEDFNTYGILLRIKAVIIFLIFMGCILCGGILFQVTIFGDYLPATSIILVALYWFYRVLSFEKRPWQYGIVGAIIASVLIVLIGLVYLFFINTFTSYSNIYGPISSVIVMLLSIHLIAGAIYFGYCLNHAFNYSKVVKCYKNAYLYAICSKYLDYIVNFFNKIKA